MPRKPSHWSSRLPLLGLAALIWSLDVVSYGESTGGSDSKLGEAKAQINQLSSCLDMFESDIGRYPTDNEGFNALIECPADLPNPSKWKGPYIKKIPLDPWIHPYKYVCSSKFDIISAGPDGKEGTADDIQAKDKYVNRGTEFGYSVSMGPPIWLVYLTLVLLLAASVASAIRKASWITIAFGCAVALCLLSSLAVKLAIHGIQFDDTQRKQAILQTMANASSWVDTVAYLLAAAGAIGLIFKNRTKAGSSESLSSNEVK